MMLDDFVMLGTTVPEPNSDGRIFVCSAGVSQEMRRLVRIYPLARRNIPHRWDIHRVPVEVNPKDSRLESFRVSGDRTVGAHEHINAQFTKTGAVKPSDRARLLSKYAVGSIKEANQKRLSLAIVHPDAIELDFDHNPDSPLSPQLSFFDGIEPPKAGARRFPFIPRLRFHDDLGWHNLMLRDWGCYELMRKHEQEYYLSKMGDALHLTASSSLLVGNQNHRRTSWLVISVLNGLREAPTLFDAFADERPPISDKLRQRVYERDEWACRRCGSDEELTVDHIHPYSRGGSSAIENLQTLCRSCNLTKSDGMED